MLPPTKEFLDELVLRARVRGHDGDYVELVAFILALYHEAHLPRPTDADLEPFPCDD